MQFQSIKLIKRLKNRLSDTISIIGSFFKIICKRVSFLMFFFLQVILSSLRLHAQLLTE